MDAFVALIESEARHRAILEASADAIITINEQGVIENFNRAAERMFGYSPDEVIGQNLNILMPSPYRENHDDYLKNYLYTGERKIIGIGRQVIAERRDGTVFPIELSVTEVLLPEKRLFTGFVRDISDRKKLEYEVLRIGDEERSKIGRDLHDSLASQLAGIAMGAQGLANASREGRKVTPEFLERLARMVEDAAVQARALSHGLNPVNLEEDGLGSALQELVSDLKSLSSIPVDLFIQDNLPHYSETVALQLFQVAREALNNAIRHAKPSKILLKLFLEDGFLVMNVCDDGVGLQKQPHQQGMGLHVMEYRANMIGASFFAGTGSDGNTHVTCKVPIVKSS